MPNTINVPQSSPGKVNQVSTFGGPKPKAGNAPRPAAPKITKAHKFPKISIKYRST